jgi:peptide/nickel transport system permease protein
VVDIHPTRGRAHALTLDGGGDRPIARFLVKRVLLGLVTLWLLSVIIFSTAQVLPGDVARRILGPLADAHAVSVLNHQLGTDRPLLTQYFDWIGGFVTGDFGESLAFRRPVGEVIGPALQNSAKLALLAFVIVVPLGILGGVVAALNEGKLSDRIISIGGLSATAVPEFVWAVALIIVFSLSLGLLPSTAQAPDGAGPLTQVEYLLLPSLCLVFVLFGYLARMARAGTIEALDADYTRTAVIKGLPQRTVVRRHVLRNSLLPTIAVIATQTGYLFGGLVIVEVIFNYNGLGQVLYRAAQQKDFPLLQSSVLIIGLVYLVATLVADILYSVLNPRVRLGSAE